MNTEFEKYAREQFDGHEAEVDTDALWANVQPHVQKEKGNRRVIWFFLFGLLAGIAIISLFNYNQDNNMEANNATTTTTTTTTTTDAITEKVDHTEQKDLNNQESSMSLSATANSTSNTTATTESDFTKVNTPISNDNDRLGDNNNDRNKTTTSKSVKPTAITPSIATTPVNQVPQNKVSPAKTINTESTTSSESNISLTKNNSLLDLEQGTIEKENESVTNKLLIKSLNTNMTNPINDPTIPESQQENALDSYTKNLSRLKKATKKLRVGLGVYGGISKATTNFSSSDSISSIYEAERNSSEKRLETLHLGLGISVYSNKNIYLRSGAEYTRIASVFNFNSTLTTVDTNYNGIKEIVINNITGEIDTTYGAVPTTTTTEFIKKHYNYIHLIDIPVIVGYQFEYAPWSIGIEGGIYANISAKYTGEISSRASDAFYDLEKDESRWFKPNIGIQPYIGLNAAYNVSDNFQVHFSPGFRFETLFSTDKNPVQEKHSILGIKAGVRYIFD